MHYSKSLNEIHRLLSMGELKLESPVTFYFSDGSKEVTTAGRLLIWEIARFLPTEALGKRGTKKLVTHICREYPKEVAIKKLKQIQDLGFEQATKSGLSLCIDDCKFDFGIDFKALQNELDHLPVDERIRRADTIINNCVDQWLAEVPRENPLYRMGESGARVSPPQIRSMIVAKGLLTGMDGKISPHPIMENLAGGLSPVSYFRTAGPARKGLANNFFVVPATGYYARQLVNTARDLTVIEEDCGDTEGFPMPISLSRDRWTAPSGHYLTTEYIAEELATAGDYVLNIRSPMTCKSSKGGICQKCAGTDPATEKPFYLGFGLGVAAGQHISEPATQLGLRGKHTSGSITLADFENDMGNLLSDILIVTGGIGTQGMSTQGAREESHGDIVGRHRKASSEKLSNIVTDDEQEQELLRLRVGTEAAYGAAQEIICKSLAIFGKIGIGIAPVHMESILRGCTNVVVKGDGSFGLRTAGDCGDIIFEKVSSAGRNHPSWLRAIGHSHVQARLSKAILHESVSYDVPMERVMSGRLIHGEY